MLVSHPKMDFKGKFDYYFVNSIGDLTRFQSEKKLTIGSIAFYEAFPAGDYLMKITDIIEVEDKIVVKWESFEVILCR